MGVINTRKTSTLDEADEKEKERIEAATSEPLDKDELVEEPKEDKKNMEVVLDGPLGKVYTQALNLVYSNEGLAAMTGASKQDNSIFDEETPKPGETEQGNKLYVYCCDDNFDQDSLLDAVDNISKAKKEGGEVMVSMECRNPNSKIGLLHKFSTDVGAKIYFNRDSCISDIVRRVKV